MKVLVTGVTGKTGRRVVESLVSRGVGVRALVRDLGRGKLATVGMGVELALGDFDEPESIVSAVEGCSGAFLVSQDNPNQVEQEVNFARQAADSGVRHIVKLSSSDAGQRPYAWSVAHAKIENEIRNIGVPYSFLRPHFFMDNYLSLLKIESKGDVILEAPAGEGLIGAIDSFDIGECGAQILSNGNALNDHVLLNGPENISMYRVAEAFSNACNKSIRYVDMDMNQYSSDPEIDPDVADVYQEVQDGTMAVMSDNVETITGKRPRTIEQFAKANVEAIEAVFAPVAKRQSHT